MTLVPVSLRVERGPRPLGIGVSRPRLSWWPLAVQLGYQVDYLRLAFAGKGFLRTGPEEEWLNHVLTPDQRASVTDWLESVEYQRVDF